jgi:hypothetical protein
MAPEYDSDALWGISERTSPLALDVGTELIKSTMDVRQVRVVCQNRKMLNERLRVGVVCFLVTLGLALPVFTLQCAQVGGMVAVAERFRSGFRDAMYVADAQDIADDAVVKKTLVCAVGHPGICKTRDARILKACGAGVHRLHGAIKEAKLLVGSCL